MNESETVKCTIVHWTSTEYIPQKLWDTQLKKTNEAVAHKSNQILKMDCENKDNCSRCVPTTIVMNIQHCSKFNNIDLDCTFNEFIKTRHCPNTYFSITSFK